MNTEQRRTIVTRKVIKKMAWYTAQGKGQRAQDARKHCDELGINPDLPLVPQL